MKTYQKVVSLLLTLVMAMGLCGTAAAATPKRDATGSEERAEIEHTLNLANNENQEWTYDWEADAWVLSVVPAVAYPEIPDQQGVSVCIPGAYVTGIDTNGDRTADVSGTEADKAIKGGLVIDYEAEITSTNGQVYTAKTAPVILNTGAAGYSSQQNQTASTQHAADGYINVACGNRGKQDTATDESGNTYYTGDAPSCLVDQKAAARYVKYNILLGNLPGSAEHLVSTGGSGGGAHAAMFAATGNSPDFYDYQIEAGAVGVYRNADGSYSTTVTIDGTEHTLSDGAWGCIAYSAITPLADADMALAFEYYLNPEYSFKTDFQKQLASYLAEAYMDHINAQNLSVKESDTGFDLDGDDALSSTVALTIERDMEAHPETNGYYGSYLALYLAEFRQNLQWYVDHLNYAEGWTWFDENGEALSDSVVAAMTSEEKTQAFLEGRYAASSAKGGMMSQAMGGMPDGIPDEMPDGMPGKLPNSGAPQGEMSDGAPGELPDGGKPDDMGAPEVGTPDEGTTQSNTGSRDSANYKTYQEMLAAYKADVEEVYAGDIYGNNIVELYDPLNYIGAEETEQPTWTKIMMGAAEGDMSLFSSLNLQIAWLNAGVNAELEWQWNGGHVPSEIFGDSFSLYVDQMYGTYVDGAIRVTKPSAEKQTSNGTAESATGTDISGYVTDTNGTVSFSLASAAAYRTAGASKAMPAFDVIDYGQEDYVFGNAEKDARHWDKTLLDILTEQEEVLSPLFNASGEGAEAETGLPIWAWVLIGCGVLAVIGGGALCAVSSIKKRRKTRSE